MELSYAQNLEDYHLAQVFAEYEGGFYIDIGAGHPVADNVSFWFYLQGWRGLVVEPQRELAERYRHVRPRDVVAGCLVGDHIGEADFFVVDRLHGFSTTIEDHAKSAASFGAGFATRRLPTMTLAALCEQHGIGGIDFLKVDVEGAEAQVLRGADWRRWRPKVVLVEAVMPGTMAESFEEWEPLLLDADYRFVFFDGLNRFYLAREASDLAARFPREKAPWDAVRHLYEFGRAPENPEHPDHALARALADGFLAALPALDRGLLLSLMDSQEAGKLSAMMQSHEFRAALGRIAAAYDGGQLLE